MHIADHPLRGNCAGNAVGTRGQQLHQPALHGRLKALLDLVVGQEAARARVLQQDVIEALGQRRWRIGSGGVQQRGGGGAGLQQALLPGVGQRLAGVVQLGCFHVVL